MDPLQVVDVEFLTTLKQRLAHYLEPFSLTAQVSPPVCCCGVAWSAWNTRQGVIKLRLSFPRHAPPHSTATTTTTITLQGTTASMITALVGPNVFRDAVLPYPSEVVRLRKEFVCDAPDYETGLNLFVRRLRTQVWWHVWWHVWWRVWWHV